MSIEITYYWPTLGDAVSDIQRDVEHIYERGWVLADKIRATLDQFGRGDRERIAAIYDTLEEHTRMKRQTLYNLAAVAKKFPPERRAWELTVSHHVVLLGVQDDDQLEHYLGEAAGQNMSVNRLRYKVHGQPTFESNGQVYNDDAPPYTNEPYYAESDRADTIARLVCPHCGKEFAT